MILVDTSVWIDHLNKIDPVLEQLLRDKQVLGHPFVIGELAVGSMRDRENFLRIMHRLPKATVARRRGSAPDLFRASLRAWVWDT